MNISNSLYHKVQALREQLDRLAVDRRGPERSVTSSGSVALDKLLPAGGFVQGTLVEWLSAGPGSGAGTLALIAARQASVEGGAVVVMDRGGWFYPPAAEAWGIDLENLILVRATSRRDELWALDQALRCPGVAAVWSPWDKRLDQRDFRRLQLAAESAQGLGLLLRPAWVRGYPSWSDLQLLVEPIGWAEQTETGDRVLSAAQRQCVSGWGKAESPIVAAGKTLETCFPSGRRLRVQLVRGRGPMGGQAVELEMDDRTGVVKASRGNDEARVMHLAARLAPPASARRSTGA